MMRSLFSGVAGLKTHQTRMDVIGNNIANVNTTICCTRQPRRRPVQTILQDAVVSTPGRLVWVRRQALFPQQLLPRVLHSLPTIRGIS